MNDLMQSVASLGQVVAGSLVAGSLAFGGLALAGSWSRLARLTLARDAGRPVLALDSLWVVHGWAWAFDPAQAQTVRASEQFMAQQASRGLWQCGVAGPVPPKLWRGFKARNKRRYRGSCTW